MKRTCDSYVRFLSICTKMLVVLMMIMPMSETKTLVKRLIGWMNGWMAGGGDWGPRQRSTNYSIHCQHLSAILLVYCW